MESLSAINLHGQLRTLMLICMVIQGSSFFPWIFFKNIFQFVIYIVLSNSKNCHNQFSFQNRQRRSSTCRSTHSELSLRTSSTSNSSRQCRGFNFLYFWPRKVCHFQLPRVWIRPQFRSRLRKSQDCDNAAFKELCDKILKSQNLKAEKETLTQWVKTITKKLLKRTLKLTAGGSSLTSISTKQRYISVMQRISWHHISQLPLRTCPTETQRKISFHLFGCLPSSTPEVIQQKLKCLLQIIHLDKTFSVIFLIFFSANMFGF